MIQQPSAGETVAKRPSSSNLASTQQVKSASHASLMSNKSFPANVDSSSDEFPDIPAPGLPAVAASAVADASNAFCEMAIDAAAAVQDSSAIDTITHYENGISCQQSSKPSGDIGVLSAPDLVTISMETEVPVRNSNLAQLTKTPSGPRDKIPSGAVGKETTQAGSNPARDQFLSCSRSGSSGNGLFCCCSGLAAARSLLMMVSSPVFPVDDAGYCNNDLIVEKQGGKQPSDEPAI